MSKFLLKEIKTFMVDTELEAQALVDGFRRKYDVVNHSISRKEKKEDVWFIVKITTRVNDEKDPCETYTEVQ